MRSHISLREEHFKIMMLTTICNESKQIIYVSGEIELLQALGGVSAKTLAPKGWIVRTHIDWRGERLKL